MYHLIQAETFGTPAGNPKFSISSHNTLTRARLEANRIGLDYKYGVTIVDDVGNDPYPNIDCDDDDFDI